jgi:hypothetical protein
MGAGKLLVELAARRHCNLCAAGGKAKRVLLERRRRLVIME